MGAYTRLSKVAELDYDDSAELAQYRLVRELIDDCRIRAANYRQDPGFNGRTAGAARQWLSDFEARLEARAAALEIAASRHALAREAMLAAKTAYDKLSPELLSNFERRVLPANGPYILNGHEVTGDTYVAHLAAERKTARDAAATKILNTMNHAVSEEAGLIDVDPRDKDNTSSPTSHHAPTVKRPSINVVKPPKVNVPAAPHTTPPITEHPVTPTPGTHPNPAGGYEPPPVTHRDDPRWDPGYNHQPVTPPGAVIGGVIGAGATALGVRLSQSGLSGSSALALQNVMGPGSTSSLANRAAVAGSAGRAPAGGILSNAAKASAATGAANQGAGAKTTEREGKKRKRQNRKLRGYLAPQTDEELPTVTETAPGAAPGSTADLSPLRTTDDADRW